MIQPIHLAIVLPVVIIDYLFVTTIFHCFRLVDQEQANISLPHKSATSMMTVDLWAQTVTNRHICDGS